MYSAHFQISDKKKKEKEERTIYQKKKKRTSFGKCFTQAIALNVT